MPKGLLLLPLSSVFSVSASPLSKIVGEYSCGESAAGFCGRCCCEWSGRDGRRGDGRGSKRTAVVRKGTLKSGFKDCAV